MKIKLLLKHDGTVRKCKTPFPEADHALAEGACPYCNVMELGGGFKVAGASMRPSDDDRAYEANAGCLACKAHLGTLRVETNTLFGVREDEAVLRGRCRVY